MQTEKASKKERMGERMVSRGVARRTYTVQEAALVLGISHVTLYRLMKEGKIAFVKIGARRFFDRAKIDAIVAGEVSVGA